MHFLEFILLLLIPSNISAGDCQSNISLTRGQNPCFGQNFTIMCQFNCSGSVKLMKGDQEMKSKSSVKSLNSSAKLVLHIDSANQSHTGTYSCQTESFDFISMTSVTVVDDCSEYLSTVNTSFPLTNTTNQSSTPSWTLEPVLIWYILFKTGFFLIGSLTAALTTVRQKH